MAGKVTALRYQKRTQERVNVFLDGEFAFGLPALEAARLHVGQQLTDDDVARLMQTDAVQKAYDRALHFLSYRPRSQGEVERNLSEAAVDSAVVEAVVERLKRQGLLDDVEFARYWVENREQFRPRGDRALRQELRQKGVPDDVAAEAVGAVDSGESAYRAARPRAQRMEALAQADPRSFREKLSGFLLRRGFGYEVVRETVKRLEAELRDEAAFHEGGSTRDDESE